MSKFQIRDRAQSLLLSMGLVISLGLPLPVGNSAYAITPKGGARSKPAPLAHGMIKVPYRSWLPEGKGANTVLLCVHGLGFSSEAFQQFGHYMAGRGIPTYALDVRGFGQWVKMQGHQTVDFESCVSDVEQALRTLHKAYPQARIFLVGESMGGAIALRVASRFPDIVNGLISAVPSSDRFAKSKQELIVGIHLLRDPDKPIDVAPLVVKRCTEDPVLQQKWSQDSYNHMSLSPAELKHFDQFMKDNHDSAALIEKIPVLMLAGFKDKLVKPEGTIDLFNELSTPDKLMVVVGDGEHLLLEEDQLTNETAWVITGWLTNKTKDRTKHPV
jgi:acylglycerol lipase